MRTKEIHANMILQRNSIKRGDWLLNVSLDSGHLVRPRPHVYVFIALSYCFRPLFSTPLRMENNISKNARKTYTCGRGLNDPHRAGRLIANSPLFILLLI